MLLLPGRRCTTCAIGVDAGPAPAGASTSAYSRRVHSRREGAALDLFLGVSTGNSLAAICAPRVTSETSETQKQWVEGNGRLGV